MKTPLQTFLIVGAFLINVVGTPGCSATTTHTEYHRDGTRTVTRLNARGKLLTSQRFYIDSNGNKVLHGDSLVMKPGTRQGVVKEYARGVLVQKSNYAVFP